MMKKNMNTTDRVIRILVAVVLAILVQQGMIAGIPAIVLAVIGIVFLLTSLTSFCPLYRLLGISTCPVEK